MNYKKKKKKWLETNWKKIFKLLKKKKNKIKKHVT